MWTVLICLIIIHRVLLGSRMKWIWRRVSVSIWALELPFWSDCRCQNKAEILGEKWMRLAHKVTTYSNAIILKRKWFHTIISGHFLELCATQAAQRVTNHTLCNSARFPVVPGVFVCLLGPCAQKIIYFLAAVGFVGFLSLVHSLNLLHLSKNKSHTEGKLENLPKSTQKSFCMTRWHLLI